MASEPLFEERSDAAKVSETPYPTNGSGKNPGRGCSYQICFPVPAAGFFAKTQYSAVPFYSFAYFHRSRMTAGVLLVFYDILTCVGQLTSIAPQSRMFSCHNKLLTVGILDSLTKRRCFFKI